MQGCIHVWFFLLSSCVLSNSAGTTIKERYSCPKSQCWGKNEGKNEFEKDALAKLELWTRKRRQCGVWSSRCLRVKAVREVGGTARHLPFIWLLCGGAGRTPPTQLCDYTSYECIIHKRMTGYDFKDGHHRVTTYSHCSTSVLSGAKWPCAKCAV